MPVSYVGGVGNVRIRVRGGVEKRIESVRRELITVSAVAEQLILNAEWPTLPREM